jgi:hypothetical protein
MYREDNVVRVRLDPYNQFICVTDRIVNSVVLTEACLQCSCQLLIQNSCSGLLLLSFCRWP